MASLPPETTALSGAEALEAFVSDNPDLQELERLVAPFNIFEALGATWHELRHSDFLAYLLDPSESHGLGAEFPKRFVAEALRGMPREARPISLVDVDIWDLADLEVRREWHNIDIFLLSREADLAVIVENKILSGEHDDQLDRYWSDVGSQRVADKLLGIFLSPSGEAPKDDQRYAPLGYAAVCGIIEQLAETRASRMGADVRTLLVHYAAMLRRHVLEDSEVAELARRIYKKHRVAIDLIVEHRPDLQQQIRSWLDELIKPPQFEPENSSKRLIRFAPTALDRLPLLGDGSWVKSRRVLVFEIENTPTRLWIKLIIGPGDVRLRQALFDWALAHRPPLRPTQSFLGKSWNTIWQHELLSAAELAEDPSVVEDLVRQRWRRFVDVELPELDRLLTTLALPTELVETSALLPAANGGVPNPKLHPDSQDASPDA